MTLNCLDISEDALIALSKHLRLNAQEPTQQPKEYEQWFKIQQLQQQAQWKSARLVDC